MKLDWRDWRVVLGAMGISLLIIIGSYFGIHSGIHWLYQIDSHPAVHGTYPDSDSEIITSDEEVSFEATGSSDTSATDEAETGQVTRETLAQLRVKKEKLEAEIHQLNNRRTELNNQSVIDYELVAKETPRDRELRKEIDMIKNLESLGDFYSLKKQEIDAKMTKLFDERLAVMHRIKDLESQLAAE